MTTTKNPNLDVERLRRDVTGRVIAPDDAGYDTAHELFSPMYDTVYPAVVVQPTDAKDVATVLAAARETGLELAIRSGGHSAAGHSTTNGGIVVDLRALKALEIDLETNTAWAASGLTAAEYSNETNAQGLATGLGDTGSVGLGGITLGGGIGFLVRKHGMTIDSLLAAEVVTADGDLVQTDQESHPDLFWAIRGGGGNFGVATRFQLRLQPLDNIVGGMMILPATPEAILGFIAEAEAAPEELSTIANAMTCPPMPFVPEELHGSLVIMALVAWCGEIDEGQKVMDRFRALAPPIADMVEEMPYPGIYGPEDEEYRPLAVAKTMWADSFDQETAETILGHLEDSDAPMRVAQLRVLGGAMARVPNEATAFAHRDRKMMINVASFFEGPDDRPRREQWVSDLTKALTDGDLSGYVGFLADEGQDRVRAAYPGTTWDRLRQVKAKYDPGNLFRLNQNIPPA
ncbi:MAG: FAD-binding oxidoreductase [Acidimicrobiia bacterium]